MRSRSKARRGVEKAKAAVNSERYRGLGLRVALWIANGEWSRSPEPLSVAPRQRPALEFAVEQLAKRTRKISKKIEDIETLDAQRRHKLRISVKELRYACEFFARLVDSRKQTTRRKHFVKTLKNLQGSLGNLNDFEVHKRLATRIAHPRKRSRKQTEETLALGFIAGQEHQEIATCLSMARTTGEQLSDLPKFWNWVAPSWAWRSAILDKNV